MRVRPAAPADASAIIHFIAMAESEMVHHFTGTTDPVKGPEALLAFVLNPVSNRYSLDNTLVAEIDGEAVGAIMAFPADKQPALDTVLLESLNSRGYGLDRLFPEGEPGTWYMSTMGVDPQYRGRGVGSALMAAAEKEGGRRGFTLASLLVSKKKDKARALYERAGFRVLREVSIVDVEYYRLVKEVGISKMLDF